MAARTVERNAAADAANDSLSAFAGQLGLQRSGNSAEWSWDRLLDCCVRLYWANRPDPRHTVTLEEAS